MLSRRGFLNLGVAGLVSSLFFFIPKYTYRNLKFLIDKKKYIRFFLTDKKFIYLTQEEIDNIENNNNNILPQEVWKKFVASIFYFETEGGNINFMTILEFFYGKLGRVTTTGPFELNISNYQKNDSIKDYEKAFDNLQKFEVSLNAFFRNIKDNIIFFDSFSSKKFKDLSDIEKIFYLSIAHNSGFTSYFALVLQFFCNRIIDEKNLEINKVIFDGRIGAKTKEAVIKIIDFLILKNEADKKDNGVKVLRMHNEINKLSNSYFVKNFSNLNFITFLNSNSDIKFNGIIDENTINFLVNQKDLKKNINYPLNIIHFCYN